MTPGDIYLRQGDGLVPMIEQPYVREDVLQALLADYPDLLAGDQANGEPRRWLLLAREAPPRQGIRFDSQMRLAIEGMEDHAS